MVRKPPEKLHASSNRIQLLCDLVTAALSIANIVKSSLGPLGLDKMLVDNIGVRERCGVVYFPLRSLQSQTRPGFSPSIGSNNI